MVSGLGYLGPVFLYLPVRTDPDGGADDTLDDLSIHLLLSERPVCGHDLLIRIGQEEERKAVLVNELLMGGLAVW